MQRLPVGIQSFDMLRNEKLVYVDKTKQIYDLATGKVGYYLFLSRPRRFGKSLLISTLKELFLGNKHLFESLWIHSSDYHWKSYHVIHLDFSAMASRSSEEFHISFAGELDQIAEQYNINMGTTTLVSLKFKYLVTQLARDKKVVLLIDEYDRPLLQHVDNREVMREIRTIMSDFYTTVKSLGGDIAFLFMTGVTKFSKTSVFSGMNNLVDLTLMPEAADLLGYTDTEIDLYFQPHMELIAQQQHTHMAEVKNNMKHWYNGYQFSQNPETVFNPFSVLMYLLTKSLRNYWFESGTPTFLVSLIKAKQYNINELEHAELHVDSLALFDIDTIRLIPLLLQTGYLTIKGYNPKTQNYQLGYPNEETKASFLLYFMEIITTTESAQISNAIVQLTEDLNDGNLEKFFTTLKVFFASVPYTMQLSQEKYYQSIFYVILSLLGAYVQAEVTTNNGRIDCTIETDKQIYIFEFKLYDDAHSALEQIEQKQYYQKFLHTGKAICLIGVAFDIKQRNIVDWTSKEII